MIYAVTAAGNASTPYSCVRVSPLFVLSLLFLSVSTLWAHDVLSQHTSPHLHGTTHWEFRPSLKYDVLTLLNTLTDDPFYQEYYPTERAHFDSLITPPIRAALTSVKKKIKDDGGTIISAFLSLYFSATSGESLDDLIAIVDSSDSMRKNLRNTPYYDDDGWALYESVRPELRTIFTFLKSIDFPGYWRSTIAPRADARIKEITPDLARYNVIREDERLLGHPLESDTITVYMLYFSQPHGIRIVGTRFLTDVAWPLDIVLRNAVHEMMHPPYDLVHDTKLRDALNLLKGDAFLMDRIEHHNPSFGYNSFEGFIEEDVVQAMEQVVEDHLGIANDPRERWKQSDDGMHVFAVALYSVMKEKDIVGSGQNIRDFLIAQITRGALKPGNLQRLYESFYGAPAR